MISLKEAFNLFQIEDNQIIHLREEGASRWFTNPMTGKEIRDKLDMQKVQIIHAIPRFSFGEYEGLEFEVKGCQVW